MKWPRSWVLAVVLATLISLAFSGWLVASTMGFRLNKPIMAGRTYWISLPYRSPYATADDLLEEIGGGTVYRLLPTEPPIYVFWNGRAGNADPPNFALAPGEAYEVNTVSTKEAIIDGSHDPTVAIPPDTLALPPARFRANMTHLVSIPYHSTARTAQDLIDQIASDAPTTVCRLEPASPPELYCWDGVTGNDSPPNFELKPGFGYTVTVAEDTDPLIPLHY